MPDMVKELDRMLSLIDDKEAEKFFKITTELKAAVFANEIKWIKVLAFLADQYDGNIGHLVGHFFDIGYCFRIRMEEREKCELIN